MNLSIEAEKRKESVESMGQMMNGITERLNDQQTKMELTCKENDELRSQLGKISEVFPSAFLCMLVSCWPACCHALHGTAAHYVCLS